MHAVLDASALKPFTKALVCLSKYGDTVTLSATQEHVSLSAANSAKSAFCLFKYEIQFFSRYSLSGEHEGTTFTGQLMTKPLLSILRNRSTDKSVERCEMRVEEKDTASDGEGDGDESDSLESRLTIRLHCKHGVIKTHRLQLSTDAEFLAPVLPDIENQSLLTIAPRPIRDIIDHFPSARNSKSDPQLLWTFGESQVQVRSMESSLETRGRLQLSSELSISSDEFDSYGLAFSPVSIAFHLREFNATLAFAESSMLSLDIRFTEPNAPLYVDVSGDNFDSLSVISLTAVPGNSIASSQASNRNVKKREREETPAALERLRRPMKVVRPSVTPSATRQSSRARSELPMASGSVLPDLEPDSHSNGGHESMGHPATPSPPSFDTSMGPPPVPSQKLLSSQLQSISIRAPEPPLSQHSTHEPMFSLSQKEPLFFPGSSQPLPFPSTQEEGQKEIDSMTQEELNAMMDDEINLDDDADGHGQNAGTETMKTADDDSYIDEEDDLDMVLTQKSEGFQPLFDD